VQVLESFEILSFLESDENTAPATLLEPPKKPVLAREREARLKEGSLARIVLTAV